MDPIQCLLKTSGLTELCQVTVNFFPFKQKILKYFLTKEVNLWCCICFLAWKELQQVQRDLAEPCPSQRLWAHQSCPQCWEHSDAKINLLAVFSFQKPSRWHQRDWQALIISECKGDTCSAGAKGEFDLWVTKQCSAWNCMSTRPVQAFWQLKLTHVAQRPL